MSRIVDEYQKFLKAYEETGAGVSLVLGVRSCSECPHVRTAGRSAQCKISGELLDGVASLPSHCPLRKGVVITCAYIPEEPVLYTETQWRQKQAAEKAAQKAAKRAGKT